MTSSILIHGFAAAGAEGASAGATGAAEAGAEGIASAAGTIPSAGTESRLPISTPSKKRSTQSNRRHSPAIVIIRVVSDKVYCICYDF
ncbi:MAG: hypothetical protein Q8K29_02945 [Polaromonas sp.]|nr:hypothetical protein [Polaromonas sp.]